MGESRIKLVRMTGQGEKSDENPDVLRPPRFWIAETPSMTREEDGKMDGDL